MKIYHYCPVTFEFLRESDAKVDPLVPGRYLFPSNTTNIRPATQGKNKIAVFVLKGKKWIYKADFRGTEVYEKESGFQFKIFEIGEIPDNVTTTPPTSDVQEWNESTNRWKKSTEKENKQKKGELIKGLDTLEIYALVIEVIGKLDIENKLTARSKKVLEKYKLLFDELDKLK